MYQLIKVPLIGSRPIPIQPNNPKIRCRRKLTPQITEKINVYKYGDEKFIVLNIGRKNEKQDFRNEPEIAGKEMAAHQISWK